MDNPGIYNLGDATITAALTDTVITAGTSAAGAAQALIDRLDGMKAVTLYCEMTGGTSGTSIAAVVETSINQGQDWLSIARFEFTNTAGIKVANLSGLLSKAIASYTALSTEAVIDGVLGDRLRAKLTTVGVYTANTSISLRAAVR